MWPTAAVSVRACTADFCVAGTQGPSTTVPNCDASGGTTAWSPLEKGKWWEVVLNLNHKRQGDRMPHSPSGNNGEEAELDLEGCGGDMGGGVPRGQ